jgi:hypothetical protein
VFRNRQDESPNPVIVDHVPGPCKGVVSHVIPSVQPVERLSTQCDWLALLLQGATSGTTQGPERAAQPPGRDDSANGPLLRLPGAPPRDHRVAAAHGVPTHDSIGPKGTAVLLKG